MATRVHFMGIGGVGMAGLAVLMKARGYQVSGCDLYESSRVAWLRGEGIEVQIGHSPRHLEDVDLLVVTPAVPADEPELAAFRAAGRGAVRYRGEVLAELVGTADAIAVCGSHGKTTTSTWIAKLLKVLGEDVAWCIGGETGEFPVAHAATGPLVVEADESDGTLALYHAGTLVVNRCEYDHPDHFPTAEDYFACYETAKRQAKTVIESEQLAELPELAAVLPKARHNRVNARAAAEVALRRGHSLARIAAVLPAVTAALPDRRFQQLGDGVYTDYAHHPTELRCAIEMAQAAVRERGCGRLRVLFQPHRYSRTRALLGDFPRALRGADELVICPTYAAFESPQEGGGSADLYLACRTAGLPVKLAQSCEEAWTHVVRTRRDGDFTLVLGAGDLLFRLQELSPRRIWIGAGSNTWRSDLDLGVEYVRTEGPAGVAGATLGIPWMAGIPGTVGGWIKMNAGAFGHSISEVLSEVKVEGVWRSAAECGFAYRHSEIKGEIQDFRLNEAAVQAAKAEDAAEYLARRHRFPAHTWGSFFKNPPGDSAARLLESVGAKELRVGGAYVWSEHANVLVAGDGATASDILALARILQRRVWFRCGIRLEPEVCGIRMDS